MKFSVSCSRGSALFFLMTLFSLLGVFYMNKSYLSRTHNPQTEFKSSLRNTNDVLANQKKPEVLEVTTSKIPVGALTDKNKPEASVAMHSFAPVFMLDSRLKNSTVITRSTNSWMSDDRCCEGDASFVKTVLNSPAGRLPIYVYPTAQDMWVSGSIIRGDVWERGTVQKFYNLFKAEKDLDFIDIGANIGVYGLTIGKLGARVLFVEPFLSNVQKLCRSIRDGGLKNVYVLHNALSSTRHSVGFGTYHGNVGGTYVRNVTSPSDESSYAILLDDVLDVFNFTKVAIKLDVETHEGQVLQGASAFFAKVDVRYLMVEWHGDKKKTGSSIIDFLTKQKMTPYHPNTDALLDIKNHENWPGDIFWKKHV